MKRYLILFVFLCLVLSSCQAEKPQNNTSVETPDTGSEKEPTQTEADSLLENLLLVDRTENSFLLADNSADHPGAVYTVGANTNLKVTVDGQAANPILATQSLGKLPASVTENSSGALGKIE